MNELIPNPLFEKWWNENQELMSGNVRKSDAREAFSGGRATSQADREAADKMANTLGEIDPFIYHEWDGKSYCLWCDGITHHVDCQYVASLAAYRAATKGEA